MIARNAKWVSMKVVNHEGTQVALVTYYAQGAVHHTLVWGAKNGAPNPGEGSTPTHFAVNYSGGYGSTWGSGYWQKISKNGVCGTYMGSGPQVNMAVKGCTAGGTFWLLQSWVGSGLPDNGWSPAHKPDRELWISHWDTAMPVLDAEANWIYPQHFDHLFGTLSYEGASVFGAASSSRGAPTDGFGRLITVDTLDPPWTGGYKQPGGWYRFNSFLTHKSTGAYCTGVYPTIAGVKPRKVPGRGKQYRVIVNGPGVTPIVMQVISNPGQYDASKNQTLNNHVKEDDPGCKTTR